MFFNNIIGLKTNKKTDASITCIQELANMDLSMCLGRISLPALQSSEQITGLVNFALGFVSGLFDLDVN